MRSHINFGYAHLWSYGHLYVTAFFALLMGLGWRFRWHVVIRGILGVLAAWALAGFLIVHFVLAWNERGMLPTAAFLASNSGRVLDMGAGTGRSSLMVLEERPNTTLVALDSFSQQYDDHFGKGDGSKNLTDLGRERLLANLKAAGVEQRATIQPGDMRDMPLDAASFDGIISAYAIDHLGPGGIGKAMSEAFRVLKPKGECLLMVNHNDVWLKLAFGPMLLHGRQPTVERWARFLTDAGFQVVEQGSRPAMLYFLARKP